MRHFQIVTLLTIVLLQSCCCLSQLNTGDQSFTPDVCAEISSNGTCNCAYNDKHDSAAIDCGSADDRTQIQIIVFQKSDVDIFCRPADQDTYPIVPKELLARLPQLGGMHKAFFLAIHHCVPFTELLARIELTRGNILHIHGLGMLPLLTARHFGQNLSFMHTVNDLELLAQPQQRALDVAQQFDADLFAAFSRLWSLKIDMNYTQLPQGIFSPFATTLSDLVLYGRLQEVPRAVLTPLRHLKTLTMHRHQLADRLREDDFSGLGLLAHLTLHNCGITALPAHIFAPLPALKNLKLTSNRLSALASGLFVGNKLLQTLDLSRNQLTAVSTSLFHSTTALVTLDLSYNRLLQLCADMLPSMRTLVDLSLEGNGLRAIAPDSFAEAPHLERLYLDHNQLNWTTAEACLLLKGLRSLNMLTLRNNSLHYLCDQLGTPNHSTRPLTLDVRNNSLQRLSTQLLRALNDSTSVRSLYLSHNPWTCDCGAQLLHTFVKANRLRFPNMFEVRCADAHLAPLVELSYRDFCLPDLGVSATFVLAFICLSALGLVFISTALCYYKYKLELQVWLYAHSLCLFCISEVELDRDRKYDAFMSYAHQDEHFVEHELLPGLEQGTPSYKVCIHVRDWLAGAFISEQIIDSVEQSRRTIIVLSQNFIHSSWARMEFRMAHQCALNEGRTRIILVIYGDLIDTELLDQELRAYLKMNTYLKWGEPWFWEKLRYAMPHSRRGWTRNERAKKRADEIPLHAATLNA